MALRDNFESFIDFAGEAAQSAARKTKKLAEIAKSNLSVYAEEDKIKKAYAELGKLYYRDYVVGEEMDEAEYLTWCRKIDESKQTIADLQDYIEVLKTDRVVYETAADENVVSEADFADEAENLQVVEEAQEEPAQ